MKLYFVCFSVVAVLSAKSNADLLVRIGDVDGFGYGTATGFVAANGGPANRDGAGVLTNRDFLPDINLDGSVSTGSQDHFDFRRFAERQDTAITSGLGVTSTVGTLGSKYTDISLSTNYDIGRAANDILINGNPNIGLVKGAGGVFPDGDSAMLPNQPGFQFRFAASKGGLDPSAPIFFNLIFGDYDVVPAELRITRSNGTSFPLLLSTQPSGSDGLIQAATATLNFSTVFQDGGSVWNGFLDVDFIAPNEPYTAFDYVELSTVALVVPEPSTLTLVTSFLVGCAGLRRRR